MDILHILRAWLYDWGWYIPLMIGCFWIANEFYKLIVRSEDDPPFDPDYEGPAMLTDQGFHKIFGVPARPYDHEVDGG